jgi:hypothetical protein
MSNDHPDPVTQLTIVWRDESREPLKAVVEAVYAEGPFLYVELSEDMLPPDATHKYLLFPSDVIESVECVERPPETLPGYRKESTFREQPGKSKWFQGMGATDAG